MIVYNIFNVMPLYSQPVNMGSMYSPHKFRVDERIGSWWGRDLRDFVSEYFLCFGDLERCLCA